MEREPGKPREGNEVIRDTTVVLDDGIFIKKSFVNCRLVYAGGRPPVLRDGDFIECNFVLEGAALNTIQFLGGIAASGGEGVSLALGMLGITQHG